ncbi:MAG: 50S ribosomal protein L21e [Candidatus Pacearchaeota archaeon]|jgi:large subunit ribosomal protein L21e
MPNRKQISERGKIRFSEYFKELKTGDKVALNREKSVTEVGFHKRIQGRVGTVVGKQGRSYIVKVMEFNKEKTFILPPIHLKKIETIGVKKK